jgi:hypothetical protein
MTRQRGAPWPQGFSRTHPDDREPYPHGFRVGMREAFRNIVEELERLGAQAIEVETAVDHPDHEPNVPPAGADPDDPAVIAYYWHDSQQYAVPCDQWDNLRDNAQAIAKYLNAKRALDRYGVETAQEEMATQVYDP